LTWKQLRGLTREGWTRCLPSWQGERREDPSGGRFEGRVEGKATDDPEKSPYFAKAFHRNPCVFSTLFATGDDKHNIGSTGP
jgi:hypothetical protein